MGLAMQLMVVGQVALARAMASSRSRPRVPAVACGLREGMLLSGVT